MTTNLPACFISDEFAAHLLHIQLDMGRLQDELAALEKHEIELRFDFSPGALEAYAEHDEKIQRAIDALKAAQMKLSDVAQILIDFDENTTPATPAH